MLEQRAAWTDAYGTRRKRVAPLPPLFAIEFLERGFGFVLLLLLAVGQNFQESVRGGICLVGMHASRIWDRITLCRIMIYPTMIYRIMIQLKHRRCGRVANLHRGLDHDQFF